MSMQLVKVPELMIYPSKNVKKCMFNDETYFVAQLLGFPAYTPPYTGTTGPALLRGVNFASGASGIRDETGNNLVLGSS